MTTTTHFTRNALRGGSAFRALALMGAGLTLSAAFAMPAYAQDASTSATAPAGQADATAPANSTQNDQAQSSQDIVVTGTLFKTSSETPSPVTTLSAATLDQRGINTVSEAVQRLPSNGAGTITTGWNTGFNFASGATAPALRGLTVQDTLSVVDGQRLAPYPLSDDGVRNFVDISTIPDAIIEKIEVLRDGASSTYGADAIAGVINVITKKEVQGLHLNASAGISSRGDAGEQRFDATYGYGDLDRQGFNFYLNAEYQHQDPLYARDRGYPFNSSDLSGVCGKSGSCMYNNDWNGVTAEDGTFNGLISIPGITLVRPVTTAGGTSGSGRFSYLNPALGCGPWPTTQVPAGASNTSPSTICEVDPQQTYQMLQPRISRLGFAGRFTANLGDNAQLYAMGNYYKTDTYAAFTPLGFNGTPTPPNNGAKAYNVIAPVYVCSTGVGTPNGLNTGCDATNGTLNPNNPYAAQGETAQLFVRSPYQRSVSTSARSLRAAVGLDGSFGDGWNYNANFTASNVKLTLVQDNYLIPQRIMDVLAQGTFNFRDLSANSKEMWDYIAPRNTTVSNSDLYQGSASLQKELFQLPGGPLQAAVGVAYRHESLDNPSANPATLGNQYERYYSVNSVGAKGSRNVKSAFFEVKAPIVKAFELDVSGRYDDYSTGQSHFSPKVGAKFTPIPQIALRGTFTKGFRIPSFNEAFGLPTTGYVTRQVDCKTYASFCAAHGGDSYATQPYSLGLTSVGNPNLAPEKSTSFTGGVILQPIHNLSITVDYWHIKIKDLIVSVTDTSAAEAAYYANNGVVNIPGLTVTPGQPDPQFPNALPLLGFIQSSFKNANSESVSGIDFGANLSLDLGSSAKFTSSLEGSYLINYHVTDSDGTVLRYDGTLSPCNITSCSGSPKWRGSWQNTLSFGDTTLSATAYYTSGYDLASIDFGGVKGDCVGNAAIAASVVSYVDGSPVLCKAKPTWNVDFTASQKIGDKFTLYANVLNIFDIAPPFDPSAAYSLFQFNPAWAGPNIMGRYFRVGARVDF